MTATTPTLTSRVTETAARLRPDQANAPGLRGRLRAALVRFGQRGQLGPRDEREIGRRTGARV